MTITLAEGTKILYSPPGQEPLTGVVLRKTGHTHENFTRVHLSNNKILRLPTARLKVVEGE